MCLIGRGSHRNFVDIMCHWRDIAVLMNDEEVCLAIIYISRVMWSWSGSAVTQREPARTKPCREAVRRRQDWQLNSTKKCIFLGIMLIQSRTTSTSWISFVWQLVEVLSCQPACSLRFCLKLWNCPIMYVGQVPEEDRLFSSFSVSGNILWESVITNSC